MWGNGHFLCCGRVIQLWLSGYEVNFTETIEPSKILTVTYSGYPSNLV